MEKIESIFKDHIGGHIKDEQLGLQGPEGGSERPLPCEGLLVGARELRAWQSRIVWRLWHAGWSRSGVSPAWHFTEEACPPVLVPSD